MRPKQSHTGAYLYSKTDFFEVKAPILCDRCYDKRRGKEGPQAHRTVYSPKIRKGVCENCSRIVWQQKPNVRKSGAKRKAA